MENRGLFEWGLSEKWRFIRDWYPTSTFESGVLLESVDLFVERGLSGSGGPYAFQSMGLIRKQSLPTSNPSENMRIARQQNIL